MSSSGKPKQAQLDMLETIVSTVLSGATHPEEELQKTINDYRAVTAPDISDEECEDLRRKLINRLSIDVERGAAITSEDFEKWLEAKKRSLDWPRWLTYKQLMLKGGRPLRVVDRMDELTDDILDLVGDPTTPGTWARRGLVLGDVQSGKTATYLGLFNKAADAGYRLIIVLAGHTESLRQQTQERVDEGFIGRDSKMISHRTGTVVNDRFVGVGALKRDMPTPIGMTTVMRDFRKGSREATNLTLSSDSQNPYVFVVKKNKSVLLALASWLDEQPKSSGKLDIPLLLLDDESDYASVNTNDEDSPTAINDAIRGLLEKFSRSSYVAFTATPFANIFIDHENTDDLFPRDFIYSLESPSNYVGALRTFGTVSEKNTRAIIELTDADEAFPAKHKSTLHVGNLPASMKEAIQAFFLANAIRDIRGDAGPRAMLINVSRFKNVQRQVYEKVASETSSLRNAIEVYTASYQAGEPAKVLDELKATFDTVYADIDIEWEDIVSSLRSATSSIRVQLFNSDKDRQLEEDETTWDRPQRLIAVGGDVLSRGLTLEGLVVSYFYRRTQASDTLMQMARWFGYRDGYEDVCRIWIDPSVAGDYRFIAESVEELRQDLRSMLVQQLTPMDFGLAVQKHPDSLLVTAKNKMKSAEIRKKTISLMDRRIETVKLESSSAILDSNYRALEDFVSEMMAGDASHGTSYREYPRWQGVPKKLVADFLDNYKPHRTDAIFDQHVISRFIRESGSSRLRAWDVVLVNGKSEKRTISGVDFRPPQRKYNKGVDGSLRVAGNSGRLAGADDLTNLFDGVEQIKEVVDSFRAKFRAANPGKEDKSIPETAYYPHLPRPSLLVYALNLVDPSSPEGSTAPGGLAVAVKLAFPGNHLDVRNNSVDVTYVVNTVAQKNWFVDYVDDEFEDLDV